MALTESERFETEIYVANLMSKHVKNVFRTDTRDAIDAYEEMMFITESLFMIGATEDELTLIYKVASAISSYALGINRN